MKESELLTVKEASEKLNLTEEEILTNIDEGSICAFKKGKTYLIPSSEIRRVRFEGLGSCIT